MTKDTKVINGIVTSQYMPYSGGKLFLMLDGDAISTKTYLFSTFMWLRVWYLARKYGLVKNPLYHQGHKWVYEHRASTRLTIWGDLDDERSLFPKHFELGEYLRLLLSLGVGTGILWRKIDSMVGCNTVESQYTYYLFEAAKANRPWNFSNEIEASRHKYWY